MIQKSIEGNMWVKANRSNVIISFFSILHEEETEKALCERVFSQETQRDAKTYWNLQLQSHDSAHSLMLE